MSPLAQLTAAGVAVEVLPGGLLRATGCLTDGIRALIRAHKPEILAELAESSPAMAHYRWRVVWPDGGEIEACFLPELTGPEVEARYPDASITPLPETIH